MSDSKVWTVLRRENVNAKNVITSKLTSKTAK